MQFRAASECSAIYPFILHSECTFHEQEYKYHNFRKLSKPNALIEYVEFFIFIISTSPGVGLRDLQQDARCFSCPKCNLRHRESDALHCPAWQAPVFALFFSPNRFINLRTTQTTISWERTHLWMRPQNKPDAAWVELSLELSSKLDCVEDDGRN